MLYETANFYVVQASKGYYEVYKNGAVTATRVATIGRSLGLARAIIEVNKRQAEHDRTDQA